MIYLRTGVCLAIATLGMAGVTKADVISTAFGTGADANVQLGSPTTNFGTSVNLVTKNTGTDSDSINRKTYLRYDLSGVTSPITTASLVLPVSVNDGGGTPTNSTPQGYSFRVYGLNDGSTAGGGILGGNWGETAINWNNAPANITSGAGAGDSVQTGTGTTNGGQATLLGTFSVIDGPGTNVLALSGAAGSRLVNFINAASSKSVTLIVTRNSFTAQGGSPTPTQSNSNSAFASKENGTLPPPALYLNQNLSGTHSASVVSDATWRTSQTSPPAGWNTDLAFDDSNAAGWQDAFKSPSGDSIWYGSNQSGQGPNNAWFRHVFNLDGTVTAGVGHFFFDDYGEVYINGVEVAFHEANGAGSVDVTLDPSIFVAGQNLIAVHGRDAGPPFNNIGDTLNLTVVPEPGSLVLLPAAALLLARRRRARR